MDQASTARQVTTLLTRIGDGDESAAERLMPIVYDELRGIAARYLKRERPDHTLQPTALVHEAFIRLADAPDLELESRAHFLAIAARVIRQILVDHARGHGRRKRGGRWNRITLDAGSDPARCDEVDLLALDEALDGLRELSERQASVVELRFFGGLSVEETALVLDVSPRTVKGDWRVARAWLWSALG